MGFSSQLLGWSVVVGALLVFVMEPVWRGGRTPFRRFVFATAAGVVSGLWGSTMSFYGFAHLLYLLLTVVPGVLVLGAVATGSGRAWLTTRSGRLLAAALLVPPVLGLYATHVEPFWLRVDHVDVATDAGAGLRIGVLADLQTRDIGDHERDAVAALIAEDPDLVVVPGDLWQTDDEFIAAEWPRWADLFAQLVEAVGPVVMIEGNTDHIGWIELIAERSGAVALHDEIATFDVDGTRVVIGGIRDVSGRPPRATRETLEALVAAEADDVVTLALSHRPDVVDWMPGEVDLIVAGHTHGGQVQLPVIGPLVMVTDVPRDVAAGGLHVLDGHRIYVSTGVGLERSDAPQVRFGARPSIGVLDLIGASTSP